MFDEKLQATARVASAYVGNHKVAPADLSTLIDSIHAALTNPAAPVPAKAEPLKPAVTIRRSVQPDYIVCLEDGKRLKMLKRYLRTRYDMTPDQYRRKWGLGADYPMVAPNYAVARSNFSKVAGLGRGVKRGHVAKPLQGGTPLKIIAHQGGDYLAVVSQREVAVLLGFDSEFDKRFEAWLAAKNRHERRLEIGTEVQVEPIGALWNQVLHKERDLTTAAKTMHALADLITTNLPSGIIVPPAPKEEAPS